MTAPKTTHEDALRAARILDLRQAGVPFDRIADREGLTPEATKAIFDQALGAADPAYLQALETNRMDRLHVAVWPAAVKGDLAAVDRVLRISERREKVAAVPRQNTHALREAFDRSASSSGHLNPDVDAALIEAGRKIADRVDEATAEGAEGTKALYLIPHMVNVLREMLATPASRQAAAEAGAAAPAEGKLARLRAVQGNRAG